MTASNGDEWETPDDLFAALDAEFDFDFDAASNGLNNKCPTFSVNSLDQDWSQYSAVWLNPPYSRGLIEPFMRKAYSESNKGSKVVCLVRFDPSTHWFQKWVDGRASEVRMLDRRVKFIGAPSCYNFPVCIVIYDRNYSPERNPMAIATEYYIWGWK